MKYSLKSFWSESKMINMQYDIDKFRVDLEYHKQKLRMLDTEIGKKLFSRSPDEYRLEIEYHTRKIREKDKKLEESNESLFTHMKEFAIEQKFQEDSHKGDLKWD